MIHYFSLIKVICFVFFIVTGLVTTHVQAQSKFILDVAGNCDACTITIEETALLTPGILDASYSLGTGLLTIVTEDKVYRAIELGNLLAARGYDNQVKVASDDDYLQLEGCSRYRELEDYDKSLYGLWVENISEVVDPYKLAPFTVGTVYGQLNGKTTILLSGVSIRFVDAEKGVTTDSIGQFHVQREGERLLIFKKEGYITDTVDVKYTLELTHYLQAEEIVSDVRLAYTFDSSALKTFDLDEEGQLRSDNTVVTEDIQFRSLIDVRYTDAVTGTQQIQLLGLSSKYAQVTRDGIPTFGNIGTAESYNLTPSAWMSNVQLSQGVGSVINGHENITGHFDQELKQPDSGDRFYLNLQGNQSGRYEGSLIARQELGEKISTAVFFHANDRQLRTDLNEDGFIDLPLHRAVSAMNLWKYQGDEGLEVQLGAQYSSTNSIGGQFEYFQEIDSDLWGYEGEAQRLDIWSKVKKTYNEAKNLRLGLQLGYIDNNSDNRYDSKSYRIGQKSFSGRLMFESDLFIPQQHIKIGLSYRQHDYRERLELLLIDFFPSIREVNFNSQESIPGAFLEYTLKPAEHFTIIGGIRADRFNFLSGLIISPRLHLRYAFSDFSVLRISGGKGWRASNPYVENPDLFTNRLISNFTLLELDGNFVDTEREQAWNFGANLTQDLTIARSARIYLDYYYTLFDNQTIVDYEELTVPNVITIRGLIGQSYGHSSQAQFEIEFVENFDIQLGYRFNFNRTNVGPIFTSLFEMKLLSPVFNPTHRAFSKFSYETKSGWNFSASANWVGEQRLPTATIIDFDLENFSYAPDYFIVNAQVRKFITDKFEMYLGCENLLDFTQDDPVSVQFDVSERWAPLFGRNIYGGIRYRLPYESKGLLDN